LGGARARPPVPTRRSSDLLDAYDVDQAVRGRLSSRCDARDVTAVTNDAFGEQEADRELCVVARRAHRDGDAFLGAASVGPRVAKDRKSTRLNSSHGKSSDA